MRIGGVVIISLLFFACNQDDEPAIADSALEGDWVLSQVLCFCGFEPDTNFALTEINFDTDRDRVTVTQNGTYPFFRDAGEYFYGGQGDRIGFADNMVYSFEVDGSRLTLTFQDNPQLSDDEVTYFFNR